MSRSLFDLIKTLSKAEKRVFAENLKKTKRVHFYKKLMLIYSKSEEYSVELDNKIFKGEHSKFIVDCKIMFKDLLYRYLVSLQKNKGLEEKIEQKLKIAQMLYSRKQFAESEKILEKIDQQAQIYEFHELMVKIKSLKLKLIFSKIGYTRETDMTSFNAHIADKYKALDRLVEMEHSYEEGRALLLKLNVESGMVMTKNNTQKVPNDVYKNLRTVFTDKNCEFSRHCTNKNWPEAFKTVIYILDLAEKHKKVVLRGQFLGNIHSTLILNCILFNYQLNKKLDVEKLLNQFDEIIPTSIYSQCTVLSDKTCAYAIHALATNSPEIAVHKIINQKIFYEKNNISAVETYPTYGFYLFVYFAKRNWEKCIEYYDKIVELGGENWNNSLYFIVRLICIYEQGELQYFSSLIDKFLAKRRKNGVKTKDSTNFTNCVFNVIRYINKGTKTDLSPHFSKVLQSYDHSYLESRYIIHWMVCQFPKLHNADYRSFLAQYHYEHFDFNAVQNKNDVKNQLIFKE